MIHWNQTYKRSLITSQKIIYITMKNITPIIIVAVLAIAGTTIYSQNQKKNVEPSYITVTENSDDVMEKSNDDSMMQSHSDDTMMKNDGAMEKEDDSMMEQETEADSSDDSMAMTDDVMEKSAGSFVDYEGTDIASLSGNIVLDFSAPWCPSCRNFEKNVKAKLDAIPSDLTIVKVDYDSNAEMRAKYGVRVQHTFVQIDNQGNKIALWTGGNDLASVVAKVQ